MRMTKYLAGVTLLEAIVALALISIVAAYAAPSFVAWQRRDRVEASARAMLAALAAARVEAIARGVRVALCRGDTEPACDGDAAGTACRAAGAWSCGWAVVLADVSSGDGVLRRVPSDPDVRVDGVRHGVVFSPPAGLVIGGFRRFEFSSRHGRQPDRAVDRRAYRCIRIAAGGRARMSVGPCEAA